MPTSAGAVGAPSSPEPRSFLIVEARPDAAPAAGALIREIARRGARIAHGAPAETLETGLAALLAAVSRGAAVLPIDVCEEETPPGKEDAMERLVRRTVEDFGRLDVAVLFCAGPDVETPVRALGEAMDRHARKSRLLIAAPDDTSLPEAEAARPGRLDVLAPEEMEDGEAFGRRLGWEALVLAGWDPEDDGEA